MASFEVTTDEIKQKLSEGWAQSTLGSIGEYINGRAFKPSEWSRIGRPIIRIQDLTGSKNKPNFYKGDIEERYIVQPGDFLISWSATLGAYIWDGPEAVLNQHIFKVKSHIETKFHYYLIHFLLNELYRNTHGTGMVHITKGRFNGLGFAVPPLAEQKRIVTKADKLLARVESTRRRLANIPAILKRFRQSVLATAYSGRLTEDWREKHPDIESAGAMVEKLYRLRLSNAKAEKEKKKIGKIYSYKEIEKSDTLPEAWSFISLSKLCDSFQYGTSKKSLKTGKVPVLRMGNLQEGKIDWSKLKYSSDSKEIKKYELLPDTVLFNRTNSPELVGKTSIYKGERPAIFAGYLIRINNHRDFLCSEYLNYCLNTNYARLFCSKVRTDGVSQSNINAQKLASFELPLCSLREQQEIVRRVEELFTLADKIENRVKIATERADKMIQSILAKAFRGQLVPTEAELARSEGRDYETAQQLLERIQTNRK